MFSTTISTFPSPRAVLPPVSHGAILRKLRLRIDHDPTYGFKRLKVGGRELEDLPRELFEITDLEFLVLSPDRKSSLFFRLTSVPREISRLANLKVLCVDTNELTDLHPSVCQLECLERLVLSNNHLVTLPGELAHLKRLKSLHLANNHFEDIPEAVFSLDQLEFLDASDNKLSRLSHRIGELAKLEALLLLFNVLEDLPESLGECSNLRNMWLGMNRLTCIPRGVGRLRHLDWAEHTHSSNLEGNPLVCPPIEVCRGGPGTIEEYYRRHSHHRVPSQTVGWNPKWLLVMTVRSMSSREGGGAYPQRHDQMLIRVNVPWTTHTL